ncbi:MAG: hypothetical protein ACTIKA_10845 [Psychroflexus halocasei]
MKSKNAKHSVQRILSFIVLLSLSFNLNADYRLRYDFVGKETFEKKEANGVDLFKGLLFSTGNLATLTTYNSTQKSKLEKQESEFQEKVGTVQHQIINVIRAKEPDYFNEFKNNITSKNHVAILKTLEKAKEYVYEVSNQLYGNTVSSKNASPLSKSLLDQMIDNSRYNEIVKVDGSVDLEKLNAISTDKGNMSLDSRTQLNGDPDSEECVFIFVFLVFVISEGIDTVFNGDDTKSQFESDVHVNEIVKAFT